MPHQPVIDALEFAQAGASLRGVCAVADFPRLRDALFSDSGTLEYELSGQRDAQGRAALWLRIRGALQLACQRCLGAMELPVDIDSRLVLAGSQHEIDAEPLTAESSDRVLASKSLLVRELIEDELLLAVPYAPRHMQCGMQEQAAGVARESPFANLGALLGGRGTGPGKRSGKR
ncbi:MAG TPA: YceD family protein [Burkholderiales bacterium]|nr:YceD family protein [Burkholderiales bacterium]